MRGRVLLDTGPLVALLNGRDRYHSWARERFGEIEPPLRTCEAVLVEACHLIGKARADDQIVLDTLRRGVVEITFSLQLEISRVQELRKRYSNVPMDLAGACLVRMTALGAGDVLLTLDSDFTVYRARGNRVIPTIRPSA